ncbi:ABC transporter permease [Streptosporangium sp. NBC_01755]|uniref:ABC transporter permease n=1 Tax=unclassified Streptosporangium TaxID=2632669 RepID=UPI002DDBD16B|nr:MULTISPECIES: ABC transporter permease [unclassified Streptosporangium]WSA23900.1 ABC transporter permease [Streptosporangium sp. NBC_01810]WSC98025.1 ABC transporter permease [Streptosporangium sp. NBC_01755]
MSGLWLVARREIITRGRTKAFVIGLVVSAVLVAALAFLPKLFSGPDSYTVGLVGAQSQVLRPALTGTAKDVTITVREFPDEAAASGAVNAGDVDAAVVDGRRLLADGEVDRELGLLLENAHRAAQTQRQLADAGLDPAKVAQAMRVTPLETVSVGADARYAGVRVGIASLLVMALFFLIIYSSMYVAMGVIEEKGSRIVEILLTSIRPWQLLGGKIVGLGALALANLVVIIVAGLGAAAATGFAADLPPGMTGIVISTLFWFILGYAFFAALAAALGSLVSRQEEANSVLTPMTMLMMITYVVAYFAAVQPGSAVARILSLVPPFSSMVMPVRMAGGEVLAWEIVVAAVLMLLATVGTLLLGARIYQRAVLRTGARVKLSEVVR